MSETTSYQTGAWHLMQATDGDPRSWQALRAEHVPTAPADVLRGRDQGYLAYPTRQAAAAAAAALAAWELSQAQPAWSGGVLRCQHLRVEFSATEVILA